MSGPQPERLTLRTDDLAWRLAEGEVVALDLATEIYLATNASGTLLWNRLRSGATRAELVDSLLERYPVTVEQAQHDVEAFVEQLAGRGLLAWSAAPSRTDLVQ